MLKKITLILFLVITIFFISVDINNGNIFLNKVIEVNATTKDNTSKNLVNIYFFHSDTCSHCKEETKFLKELQDRYSNIKIYKYEVHNQKNQKLYLELNQLYSMNVNSVPLTIIGNKIYTGFSEISKIKFIKTIDYFSNYGYEDKLGNYLKLELPTYDVNETDITLDDFLDSYHNYNLLGLRTDNLNSSNIALLLGILLSFNLISLTGIILVVFIILKIKKEKNQILTLICYIGLNSLLFLSILIKNNILTISVYFLIIILFIYGIIRITQNHKQYFYLNLIIVILSLTNLLMTYLDNKHLLIFRNLLSLHNLTGLNKLSYFNNCLAMYVIINSLITCLVYVMFKKRIKN